MPILPRYGEETSRGQGGTVAMTLRHEMLQPRRPPTDAMTDLQRQVDALSAKVSGQARRGTNIELADLAPFSPDIRSAVMPDGMKLSVFTKFIGRRIQRSTSRSSSPNCLSTSRITEYTTEPFHLV
ncbi:hypothetical protein LIER_38533 [Lithospermum erythrorhizon]|uniref:Uncharacterized protein n=1 Tax=Lithospermum erythrorhizon TaxID=34254 RepID=A0AAV3Q1Q2_LITER